MALVAPRFSRVYLQLLPVTPVACVPRLLFLIFTAPATVLLLFGPRWHSIAPIFAWVCVGGLMTPLNSGAAWIFTVQGRTHEQLIYVTLNAGISIASFVIGVIWGIVGVAFVSALSFAFIQTPLLIRAATRVGAVTLPAILQAVVPFVIAGMASAITLYCVHLDQHGVPGLIAALVTSYAMFSLVLVCLPEGRRFLTRLLTLRPILWQMA
jgi:PST family polysaccharide transporter